MGVASAGLRLYSTSTQDIRIFPELTISSACPREQHAAVTQIGG